MVSGSTSTSRETNQDMLSRVKIEESWKRALEGEFTASYMTKLRTFLLRCREEGRVVYPPFSQIFAAFDLCALDAVKVVIVGQDPYIQPGQAHGLCFSVPSGIRPPPSLENIFRELQSDFGSDSMSHDLTQAKIPSGRGCLRPWAEQGVLLLNSVLTVFASRSGSHQGEGWERFTDRVIDVLNQQREHLVFLLWGNYAKRKGEQVDTTKHLVLTAPHPSPLSAHQGFFGCRHFSKTNTYLEQHGITPIDWFQVG